MCTTRPVTVQPARKALERTWIPMRIPAIAENCLLAPKLPAVLPSVSTLSLSAAATRPPACVQACVHGDVFSSGVIVCVLSNSVTWGYRRAWRALAERTSGRPAIHPVLLPLAVLSLTVIASNKVQQLYIFDSRGCGEPRRITPSLPWKGLRSRPGRQPLDRQVQ